MGGVSYKGKLRLLFETKGKGLVGKRELLEGGDSMKYLREKGIKRQV
jgi:hypothetical protein